MERSSRIRTPVYRQQAQTYLLVSLASFAGTVVLTRLFLEITGYPQLGGGELHIAHVLWGGLILFIAALLPLIFANRWVFSAGAVLSGVGIGLFIDEVGKFITQDNDYFYPAAAPIIYAFFLLTVLLYLRIRRPRTRDSRQELYQVLDGLAEVLDHDLDPLERAELQHRLEKVAQSVENPNLAVMAQSLHDFIRIESLKTVEPRRGVWGRIQDAGRRIESTLLLQPRMRLILIGLLLIAGAFAWYEFFTVVFTNQAASSIWESIVLVGVQRGEVRSNIGASWFMVHLVFQLLVGLFAILSSVLLILRRERRALEFGTACMVMSLTAVNLLAFFVDQFSVAALAIYQLGVLLALAYYRRRFIQPSRLA